jgi:phage shock protein C
MSNFNAPLRRSRSNRMLGGVVAGLADHFGIDITLARVLYVIGSICSAAFPGILVYIVLWIVIPEEDYRDSYDNRDADRSGREPENRPHTGG